MGSEEVLRVYWQPMLAMMGFPPVVLAAVVALLTAKPRLLPRAGSRGRELLRGCFLLFFAVGFSAMVGPPAAGFSLSKPLRLLGVELLYIAFWLTITDSFVLPLLEGRQGPESKV